MEQNMFIRILNSEMELATGCTEPGAVALTAAEAGQALRKAGVDKAEEITVNASINIIKNAMSAGIPGTDYEGMDYAAAIGALGGDPVYLLEVMNHVPRETVEAAAALVKAGKVRVNVAQVPQKLYIEVIAKGGGHTGRAIVRDLHTNVVLVEQDGVATLDKRDTDTAAAGDSDVVTPEQIASFLTVRSIWDYCTKELDPMNDPIDIIRQFLPHAHERRPGGQQTHEQLARLIIPHGIADRAAPQVDRKSTRLNSSHCTLSRMPSSA